MDVAAVDAGTDTDTRLPCPQVGTDTMEDRIKRLERHIVLIETELRRIHKWVAHLNERMRKQREECPHTRHPAGAPPAHWPAK
jgi:uncharacterized coiled-coil protein SlyX